VWINDRIATEQQGAVSGSLRRGGKIGSGLSDDAVPRPGAEGPAGSEIS
jgi:hypothetical protein